MKITFGSITLE